MNAPLFGVVDVTVRGRSRLDNPFFAELTGSFSGPEGRKLVIPGFYDGDGTWIVRFSPSAPGTWEYTIESAMIALESGTTGTITCTAAADPGIHGVLGVPEDYPHHFRYQDGTWHFMNAYECDWLWALDLGKDSLSRTEELVEQIASNKFNWVIMNMYAHDSSWTPGKVSEYDYGPPAMYAWEGTNEEPDHSRMNIGFFRHFDRVMKLLYREGLSAHLFLKVYNKKVNWPGRYSKEEDMYFRYCVARYQAFPNLLWDFSKESYNEPDKDYLLDRLLLVRQLDRYRHLVTTHDDLRYLSRKKWRNSIDFCTAQQHTDFHTMARLSREEYGMPYFNSEFAYEHGPGGMDDFTYQVRHSPEENVFRAWEVVMGGGYPAYYYTHTAWDVIDYRYVAPGYGYFRNMYDFITAIEWWKFKAAPEVCRFRSARCLARGDEEELVIFAAMKDRDHVFMTLEAGLEKYEGYWMDIYGGGKVPFTADLVKGHATDPSISLVKIPFPTNHGILYLKKK